ncbi:hypothetical protein CN918_27145 [Priestia megaterium]|nr:hypothetical protein CN918_27145 [Priestia megaterium]
MEHQDRRDILQEIAQRLYHNEQPKNEQIFHLLMHRLYCESKPISKKTAAKLVKRLFKPTLEVKVPIMERIVRRYYTSEKGDIKYEERKIKELISSDAKDGDVWSTGGKQLLSHAGIKKIADFAQVTFTNPEIIDRPNSNNRKGFYVVVGASSFNRLTTHEVGSAHDDNAKNKISSEFRFEMAYKRAMDRALLSHLGFHDIYSSEESDAWSTEENLRLQISQKNKQVQQMAADGKRIQNEMKQENTRLQAEVQRLQQDVEKRSAFIDKLLGYMTLPDTDEKYPKQYLSMIVERKDYDYMQALTKNNDKTIRYAAIRLLKLDAMHIEEQEAKRQKEQEVESIEQPQEPIKEQIKINEQIIASRTEPVNKEYQEIKPYSTTNVPQPLAASVEVQLPIHPETISVEGIEASQEVENMQQTAPSSLQSKPFTMTPINPEEKPKEFERVDFTLDDQ